MITFFLENIFLNFTNSFYNFIDYDSQNKILCKKDDEQVDFFNCYFEIISKLLNWLKIDFHPKVIYSDIVSTLEIFGISKNTLNIEPELISKMQKIIEFNQNLKFIFGNFVGLYPDIYNDSDTQLLERLFKLNEVMKKYF